jgi:putative lipoprotein
VLSLFAALLLVSVPTWAQTPIGQLTGRLKGTATYRERMALPPNAVFEATLVDVSNPNAPSGLGGTRIEQPGNPPFSFEIAYDPSRINPSHRYVLRARILVDGRLLFATERDAQVLTGGLGDAAAPLLLIRAGAPEAPARALENTYWKLTWLGDTQVEAVAGQREAHLILDSQSHRASGSGGCNVLTGSYTLNGEHLTLSQVAGTMMACPDGMNTETAFLHALERVNQWRIAGGQLELLDAAGNPVARFESRQAK